MNSYGESNQYFLSLYTKLTTVKRQKVQTAKNKESRGFQDEGSMYV